MFRCSGKALPKRARAQGSKNISLKRAVHFNSADISQEMAVNGGFAMKIAVAVDDSGGMSRHFGRSSGFVFFTVQDKRILEQEKRENRETAFAQGQCKGDHKHHDGQEHSHAGVIKALSDCDVVLTRGMGRRAAQDLEANGMRVVIVDGDVSPEEAVSSYLEGTLKVADGFCCCKD